MVGILLVVVFIFDFRLLTKRKHLGLYLKTVGGIIQAIFIPKLLLLFSGFKEEGPRIIFLTAMPIIIKIRNCLGLLVWFIFVIEIQF